MLNHTTLGSATRRLSDRDATKNKNSGTTTAPTHETIKESVVVLSAARNGNAALCKCKRCGYT
jgi:hypothetical protein